MIGHRMTDKESNLCLTKEEDTFEELINSVEAYNDTPPILCELSKENDDFFWFASEEGKNYGQERQEKQNYD